MEASERQVNQVSIKEQVSRALSYYRKYCQKACVTPSNSFIQQIKHENINLFLDQFTIKEIPFIAKVFNCFNYFKGITLSSSDPAKTNKAANTENQKGKDKLKSLTQQKQEEMAKINWISAGLSKNLKNSSNIIIFIVKGIPISRDVGEQLAEGIKGNKSLFHLIVNNCDIGVDAYEIIINGLLNHEFIKSINFSSNKLNDKCGSIIGRLISRQSERRDQVIWMLGLRNEKPLMTDLENGLLTIDLSHNVIGDNTAEVLSYALSSDNYLKSLNLSGNSITEEGCKRFTSLLNINKSLMCLDLRDNPGYTQKIFIKITYKLSKNIKEAVQLKGDLKYISILVDPSIFNLDLFENIEEENQTNESNQEEKNVSNDEAPKQELEDIKEDNNEELQDENLLPKQNSYDTHQLTSDEREALSNDMQCERDEAIKNEAQFNKLINAARIKYKDCSWAKPYLKSIDYLKDSMANLNEANIQMEEYLRRLSVDKSTSSVPSQGQKNTNTNLMPKQEKGAISVLSSNEEVFNPFINNQNENVTHMTRFYEMNPDQIRARIESVIGEISKISHVDINNITSKFGK